MLRCRLFNHLCPRSSFFCHPFVYSLGLLLVSLASSLQAHASSSVFDIKESSAKADVSVLALSTLIRTSSGNQDVYLAIVHIKGQPSLLARLVDTYPSYRNPIRHDILRDHTALRMTLTRVPALDSAARDIFLPADASKIFDPNIRMTLLEKRDEKVPVFTVEHEQTTFAH